MERLTDFELEQWDNQNPFWNVNIRKLIDEVKAYRQLEKEIGCPLKVRCRMFIGTNIYDKNNNLIQIVEICKSCFMTSDNIYHEYRNHKKTWWLKEDKSE